MVIISIKKFKFKLSQRKGNLNDKAEMKRLQIIRRLYTFIA